MISTIKSIVPSGYSGQLINIEGDLTKGLPSFNLVGLASKTITESRDRVRSALRSSGFNFPPERLTVNLAPAEVPKDGPHLDLPIALSVLILSHQLGQQDIEDDAIYFGELSLEGAIRPVRGVINLVEAAKELGFKTVYLPLDNYAQAKLIPKIKIIPVSSLNELFLHLKHQHLIKPPKLSKDTLSKSENLGPTLDDISGQALGKRALQIAVAGHHNLLLTGPPGTGKTLLGKVAPSLLPPLTRSEQISLTKLYSLSSPQTDLISSRPFRSPHHTSSLSAMLGGGQNLLPGEISLAHLGVLFLDEIPEFPRNIIEALRQPLEDRQISLSRAKNKVTYPANFMLIATMNPCPCGYLGDPVHACTCTDAEISRYQKRLSGPLLDRIDIVVNVGRIAPSSLLNTDSTPPIHDVVKNTITEAIKRQSLRFSEQNFYNATVPTSKIAETMPMTPEAKNLLNSAAENLELSARSYFKTIKVAQTIADLESAEKIAPEHISEALSFRYRPSSQ